MIVRDGWRSASPSSVARAFSRQPRGAHPMCVITLVRITSPCSARRPVSFCSISPTTLIGQLLAYERGEGAWGNREVPPHLRRGLAGETWFSPRERAGGE